MFFNFYDQDNDGKIEVKEIWEIDNLTRNLVNFNNTNWLDATFMLMDKNNDTYIEREEFQYGMDVMLTVVDLDTLAETSVDSLYNSVFPETDDEQPQRMGLMKFIKDVLNRGLKSYVEDNSTN